MRATMPRRAKLGILLVVLMLVAVACSIEAPDVILSGGAGTGGGGTTTGGGAAGGGGAVGGGGAAGGGAAGGGSAPNASDTSCVGKVTDTGVSATTIKLGGTFAASGPVSAISGPILNGVRAYFNEVNAKGGIHNRKIELKWYDDGWDAQKGKGLIKQLVEQDRVFVLTVVPSSNGLDAARSYLEGRRMPVFGTSGLIESQFKTPMQWPVGTSTRSAARIGLLDMKTRGVTNAAIIWLDLLAGAEGRDAFRKAVPSIMGKSAEDFITSDQKVGLSEATFDPVWARVQSDTRAWQSAHNVPVDGVPDFVSFLIDPTNATKALRAAQERNFKPKKGWGGGAPLFLNIVSNESYSREASGRPGLYAGTSFFPPQMAASVPAVADYIKTVQKYYGRGIDVNNPYLEGGYAGAALTVEILRRVGSCLTKDKAIQVANNLDGYSAAGLTRPLTYRSGNHYGNQYGLVVQVQSNGSWKVVSDWHKDPSVGQ